MCSVGLPRRTETVYSLRLFFLGRVDAQTGIAVLGSVGGICRTGVEVGVSDVEVVVSGVDVAGIGGPTAIIMVLVLH